METENKKYWLHYPQNENDTKSKYFEIEGDLVFIYNWNFIKKGFDMVGITKEEFDKIKQIFLGETNIKL